MSNSRVKERRAHERHATELSVQGSQDQGGVVARMVARNLSLGGLYCTSTTDFPEMTQLAVRLVLPSGNDNPGEPESVELEAVVVRREEVPSVNDGSRFDLALYFTNVDETNRKHLQRFINDHPHHRT